MTPGRVSETRTPGIDNYRNAMVGAMICVIFKLYCAWLSPLRHSFQISVKALTLSWRKVTKQRQPLLRSVRNERHVSAKPDYVALCSIPSRVTNV